jgi:hypothetical protein
MAASQRDIDLAYVRSVCGRVAVVSMDRSVRVPAGSLAEALIAKAFPTHPVAVAAADAAAAKAFPTYPLKRSKTL